MAHEWEDVNQGVEGLFNHGKRRCGKCGAEQTREVKDTWYMRITGYHWTPKVGRCPADKKKKESKLKTPPDSLSKVMKPGEVYVGKYFRACGCSWSGNITKRDGKLVTCGHKHKTKEAAEKCRVRMEKKRVERCQAYVIKEFHATVRKVDKGKRSRGKPASDHDNIWETE